MECRIAEFGLRISQSRPRLSQEEREDPPANAGGTDTPRRRLARESSPTRN